ncbi:superoxide dismutase [Salipaludibacillus sp. HK11]|uniref:superoxide dismutase n=1 Tax=Salipaludibacillus sp. HK11 TaxID=3394320 RepID=UPI0039FC15DC
MENEKDWGFYISQVDDWMTQLEKEIDYRTEQGNADKKEKVINEMENLKVLRGKLMDNNSYDHLHETFTDQVHRVSWTYEDWRKQQVDDRKEVGWGNRNAVPPGEHRLPPLPYDYAALEPVISEEIMRLHHQEHHQSYVDGLNQAELEMKQARETDSFDLIRHWEREAAFHGAGHYLHTMFWNNMSPDGGGEPTGALSRQIDKDFGSYHRFKRHFSEAAKKVQGVGWALLVWSPRSRRLEILQAEFHHLLSQQDIIPLLGLDVWEHAYYLQYKNNREEYVDQFWNIVNWGNVTERFENAKLVKWEPY